MKKQKRYYREEPQPATLPIVSRYANGDYRLVKVFVEGYDDVAFWRGIFDDYETDRLKFEISVPPRQDLAKGKRVLLDMIPEAAPTCCCAWTAISTTCSTATPSSRGW